MRDERSFLNGEFSVYPGHPVVLAYIITRVFSSYEEAVKPKENIPAAVGSIDIPGSGGCVYSAVDLLTYLKKKTLSIDEAISWADRVWENCDNQKVKNYNRWNKGQKQADSVKEKLCKHLETWLNQ